LKNSKLFFGKKKQDQNNTQNQPPIYSLSHFKAMSIENLANMVKTNVDRNNKGITIPADEAKAKAINSIALQELPSIAYRVKSSHLSQPY
jgi:hypothetical protein